MLPAAPISFSSTNSTNSTNCGKWFPYKSSSDFDHNLLMVIVILVAALTGLPAINFAVRFLRRRLQPPLLPETTANQVPKPPLAMVTTLTMAFSSEVKLSDAAQECAICLSEFVLGEMVRVLPKCKHGFHEKCIEKWMLSACSCPTCRMSLLISPEKETAASTEMELHGSRMMEP